MIFFFYKKRNCLFLFLIFISQYISSDDFLNNSYNNHGSVGLINMPTARFFEEGVHGITLYDGTPDQKITFSSSPYDWLEASFFYTNIQNKRYCTFEIDFCKQDYKDKGFNFKLRLKKEGLLPALAIGLNDFAGTGYYNSEYIVASYGVNKLDMHFGIGWGQYNGSNSKIKNPFSYLSDRFKKRDEFFQDQGGQLNFGKYFSSNEASPFYGLSYKYSKNLLLKIEKDTTNLESGYIEYKKRKNNYSFGIDYSVNNNFSLGASYERGSNFSFRFIYKNNPKRTINRYEYQRPLIDEEKDDKYSKLIKNLEANGIGVKRIRESSKSIGLELTQFVHPNFNVIEQIIADASIASGIDKNVKKDIRIADLKAVSEIDTSFIENSKLIYEREKKSLINTDTKLKFRPFIASREEFFKGALLIENETEFVIKENLFFNTNLKYSVWNNFEDLRYPPIDTFPAQVRSDIKQYLKNMNKGVLIGRAQIDYHITPALNHHIMITGGILEDMFSGVGFEYLYFKENTNFALGIESFKVRKRDYEWRFGHLNYENLIVNANFYYRNYGLIPFDLKISAGEYLAGDVGSTIEFSRTFSSGVSFGAFATFTDVSSEEFGEGSFDKGIFFNIPVYGNFINYTWRPLTKDPGAKLIRKNNLHNLLVRFRPIN